jgi:hypothetical protein
VLSMLTVPRLFGCAQSRLSHFLHGRVAMLATQILSCRSTDSKPVGTEEISLTARAVPGGYVGWPQQRSYFDTRSARFQK